MTLTSAYLDEEFIIRDLETLKVVADSLRMQILDLLREKPLTVKQLAADLDITPTKLYYHINLMEKHGLIRVVDTRLVSGILEKRYQAAARFYRFDHHLLMPSANTGEAGLDMMLSTVMDDVKADIKKSMREGVIEIEREEGSDQTNPRHLLISRIISRLNQEQAVEFYERLEELVKEFAEYRIDPDNAREQVYTMLISLYPSTRAEHHDDEEGGL
ncbi:MAG: helix-turn-helix domain-containing protein [Anaerolineae bacterium]